MIEPNIEEMATTFTFLDSLINAKDWNMLNLLLRNLDVQKHHPAYVVMFIRGLFPVREKMNDEWRRLVDRFYLHLKASGQDYQTILQGLEEYYNV